jgi:transposase-like protein
MEKITPMMTRDTEFEESAHGGTLPPRGDSVPPWRVAVEPPDPEVVERKRRRKFTAKYKLHILKEADACKQPGEIGALIRREGLYSSNLTCWRRQREEGVLQALRPKKRGRKKIKKNPLKQHVALLERENRKLKHKLQQAEKIIDVQKKISEILAIHQDQNEGSSL